ncbi:hypothetical protein H0W80_01635 [Candidatus Saccharibacteria bacterium]|nr:hypothetical protein [Candidatus Saccharibacteria bacterium]
MSNSDNIESQEKPTINEPPWRLITDFIDRIKELSEFRNFSLFDAEVTSVRSLDFFDEGVDLDNPYQLYSFTKGAMEPLRMMISSLQSGDLGFLEVMQAGVAFEAVLSSLKYYLPPEHFARYYSEL